MGHIPRPSELPAGSVAFWGTLRRLRPPWTSHWQCSFAGKAPYLLPNTLGPGLSFMHGTWRRTMRVAGTFMIKLALHTRLYGRALKGFSMLWFQLLTKSQANCEACFFHIYAKHPSMPNISFWICYECHVVWWCRDNKKKTVVRLMVPLVLCGRAGQQNW